MVILSNGIEIEEIAVHDNLKRIINQVYKLLPMREEGSNWEKPLDTLLEELKGMDRLLIDQHRTFFSLLCKMEALTLLTKEEDYLSFRKLIFECLGLLKQLKKCLV